MSANHVQPGKVLDHTNSGITVIPSGSVVVVGQILGVALKSIQVGETGSVAVDGVFAVPKVPGAVIAAGEAITWDASAGAFDDSAAVAATGDVTGGSAVAWRAAGDGATSLHVKFTGVPGTVKA